MSTSAAPRIAVIGGGAAGITAVKELIERGVDVIAFEKGDRVGGLWVQDNTSGLSPAYDSLHLNTSKGRTEFADYPMPAEWEDYPAGTKVAGWLQDYAETFGVTQKYRFNTTVTSVRKDGAGWIIETDDRARFEVPQLGPPLARARLPR